MSLSLTNKKVVYGLLLAIIIVVTATVLVDKPTVLDEPAELSAAPKVKNRTVLHDTAEAQHFTQNVLPVLQQRCMVCHGCYDAPCQLKLSSIEGLDRGATKALVYESTRLTAADPTRLFLDQQNTSGWRKNDFYSVLNEGEQSPEVNLNGGVMARLLTMKQVEPAYKEALLPADIPLDINHTMQCPQDTEVEEYVKDYPQMGMPYGLPALASDEHQTLQKWLASGAKVSGPSPLSIEHVDRVAKWEAFLNGDSLKEQMVGRYLYEHWYLAHLYFDDLPVGEFFRVMRSRTPPGQPIDIIATRRPYDDPKVDRVYYRLWREKGTILAKTHMPYLLSDDRLKIYKDWFLDDSYEVTALASYAPQVASNPFKAFEQIPVSARYQFLLEEAQFTIMNFIKGPVCRGQVSLNVINDHFWVFFVDPKLETFIESSVLYDDEKNNLALPAEAEDDAFILTQWMKFSKKRDEYMHAKAERMNEVFPSGEHPSLESIWDGDGHNTNASLTIFRHIDTATVTKGLVGKPPKTAWVIDYGLLERIHYLLVAGFDVYGRLGHLLTTRLYMDFLRSEGEFNFLALLPPETRKSELRSWYQGLSESDTKKMLEPHKLFTQASKIQYKTESPKQELFSMLKKKLSDVLPDHHSLEQNAVPAEHRIALQTLEEIVGGAAAYIPQVAFLTVEADGLQYQYTIIHNNAHSNITSLFFEKKNRLPELDTLTVAHGFIGAYPDALMSVNGGDLQNFVKQLANINSEPAYQTFMDNYGVRRTNPQFWQHSDKVHAYYKYLLPIESGLLDFSRLENR